MVDRYRGSRSGDSIAGGHTGDSARVLVCVRAERPADPRAGRRCGVRVHRDSDRTAHRRRHRFLRFLVREVFTGDVGAKTVVSSSTHSAACGRGFDIGSEYLVFTNTHQTRGAPWAVEACSATTEATDHRTRDAAIAVYGPPQTPGPDKRPVEIDDVGTQWWWWAAGAGGAAMVVVSALAAGLIHRRRNQQ